MISPNIMPSKYPDCKFQIDEAVYISPFITGIIPPVLGRILEIEPKEDGSIRSGYLPAPQENLYLVWAPPHTYKCIEAYLATNSEVFTNLDDSEDWGS